MKVRVLRKKSRCFFFLKSEGVGRCMSRKIFRKSAIPKLPILCSRHFLWNLIGFQTTQKMLQKLPQHSLFKLGKQKIDPQTSHHKNLRRDNKSRPARKDFMIAEMKAVSLSCNDPSHDGHAIHLPEPFSAVYGKSATSDRISLVFACPMMEVNTTETFLLRCKKLAWEEVNLKNLMEEILHQLRLVVYPIISRVLHIPGGAGFLPSTVVQFS